jgi:hypothetical protein
MTTPLRNSGPKPTSGPPRPMSPVKEDDLKDYFTLVELLWKMSPRELKKAMVIRDGKPMQISRNFFCSISERRSTFRVTNASIEL